MQSVIRCLAWILLSFAIGLRSFLELRSTVNSYHVALRPTQMLFFLVELMLMTGLRTSRPRHKMTASFDHHVTGNELRWKNMRIMLNRIISSFHCPHVKEPFVEKKSTICWLVSTRENALVDILATLTLSNLVRDGAIVWACLVSSANDNFRVTKIAIASIVFR